MHTCIFCGKQAPANYKNVQPCFVEDIVQRQIAAGMDDPIVNLLQHTLANVQRSSEPMRSAADEASESENEEDALQSCMCCYYWVMRRHKQKIVPLPNDQQQNTPTTSNMVKHCAGMRAAGAAAGAAGGAAAGMAEAGGVAELQQAVRDAAGVLLARLQEVRTHARTCSHTARH